MACWVTTLWPQQTSLPGSGPGGAGYWPVGLLGYWSFGVPWSSPHCHAHGIGLDVPAFLLPCLPQASHPSGASSAASLAQGGPQGGAAPPLPPPPPPPPPRATAGRAARRASWGMPTSTTSTRSSRCGSCLGKRPRHVQRRLHHHHPRSLPAVAVAWGRGWYLPSLPLLDNTRAQEQALSPPPPPPLEAHRLPHPC